jgi:starch synthase (maltosyl-transferring)
MCRFSATSSFDQKGLTMQSLKTGADKIPPRIYCVSPLSLVAQEDWSRLLARVAAMRFDTLLLTGDCVSIQSAITNKASPFADPLAFLLQECRQHGLRPMIDLELDRFPADDDFTAQHSEHFFVTSRAQYLPDPRFPVVPPASRHAQLRLDSAGVELALDYWRQTLTLWLQAGVHSFRCLGINRIEPSLWQELIAQSRATQADVTFAAWTPGCTPEQLAAIRDCGFDAVFSSDAWWDYRAGWLVEEHARLSAIGSVIAAPENPAGPRLMRAIHVEDADLAQRAYLRALQTAGSVGDGILIVHGFETGMDFALSEMRDDQSRQAQFDLTSHIENANRDMQGRAGNAESSLKLLSAPNADVALLFRENESGATIAAINADLHQAQFISRSSLQERAAGWLVDVAGDTDNQILTLQGGEVLQLQAQRSKPVLLPTPGGKAAVTRAARGARIAFENITPSVDGGRFPVKKIVGQVIDIEADIFSDGHDHLAASLWWRAADDKQWREVAMQEAGNDRWRASLSFPRIGRHLFYVQAWRDTFDTYRDELDKKTRAGLDVTLEIQEGRQLLERTIAGQPDDSPHTSALKKLLQQLPAKSRKKSSVDHSETIALFLAPETASLMRASDLRDFSTRTELDYKIDVERKAAEFSNWYELFPRSQSGDIHRHGNFDDVIARMPAVRDMGFDTLYFPPVHPIGRRNMKGKNNSLTPGPDDPGSPYAIGSEAGGHDAIHPELGTLQDFRRMLAAAKEHGMEIALDFAIQCSPDHPWLKEHPEWFAYRPDGSIRYAENPPKKYEDIVNVDFYAESENGKAIPDLWIALRDVVLMWVREGVRVFRVDNPHTKPLPFWEWMIGDIRARSPDTLFLAEAFTRPKPMYRLAKVGFSQSYTYFTWRHSKKEFTEYLTELTAENPAGGPREFFRPHFFVNTPDINPYFLQRSGRPGFLIRAALAATLSGLWGVYSGFELCEAQAVTGKEEYLDSEKYEIRAWDWHRPGNIVREVSMLNRIRNANPALQTHLGVRFHDSSNEQILYFSKSTKGESAEHFGDNVILVAINLDPFAAQDASIDMPLWRFGLPDHASVELEDLVNDSRMTWHGRQQQIHLDPQMPFAIWRVRPQAH